MSRIKLVLAVVAVMVAMIAGSAMPAAADINDPFFRFDGDHNDVFRVDGSNFNDFNDLLDLGCRGAVIDFQCFGIPTFDGIFFLDNNDGDFHNFNDRHDRNDNGVVFVG